MMNDNEMKERIQSGFLSAAPDTMDEVFESILAKGYPTELVMEKKRHSVWSQRNLGYAMAFACVMLVCFLGFMNMSTQSYVLIDVNPSIRMVLNKKNQVVKIKGLNEDGKKVAKAIVYHKKDGMDSVMALVLNQMKVEGYLKPESGMLVTVVSKDKRYEEIKTIVENEVASYEAQNEDSSLVVAFVHTTKKGKESGREQLRKQLEDAGVCTLEETDDMSVMDLLINLHKTSENEVAIYGPDGDKDTVLPGTMEKETVNSVEDNMNQNGQPSVQPNKETNTTSASETTERMTDKATTERETTPSKEDKKQQIEEKKEQKQEEKEDRKEAQEDKKTEKQEEKEQQKEEKERKKEEKKQEQEEKKQNKQEEKDQKKQDKENQKAEQNQEDEEESFEEENSNNKGHGKGKNK